MNGLRLPGVVARRTGTVAAVVWAGALVGGSVTGWWAAVALVFGFGIIAYVGRDRRLLVLALVAGSISGAGAAHIDRSVLEQSLSTIRIHEIVRVVTDSRPTRHGWHQLVEGTLGERRGVELVVRTQDRAAPLAGDLALIDGIVESGPGMVRGRPVAGSVDDPRSFLAVGTVTPAHHLANLVRGQVVETIESAGHDDPGLALLVGFLIGDTTRLPPVDADALRLAGLSHFVAVSGSNVALFLWLWWLVLMPVAVHPRLRALSGILGIAGFVLITRAEPSVVRAGIMAAVILVGRLSGVSIDGWTALAGAVTGSILVAGTLATDVGFVLSVAATCGVMAGAGALDIRPAWLGATLGASIAAQLAVAPILLAEFGTIPLLSPLSNLAAAPLVATATAVGGVGALVGWESMVGVGGWVAGVVLRIAHLAATGPQIGWIGTGATVLACVVFGRFRSIRPAAIVAIGASVVWSVLNPAVDPPAVVFLDVGQGDATLLIGDQFTAMVDAGPDAVVLARKLGEYGVGTIDLVVLTHVHADHTEGMRAVLGRIPVGALWTDFRGETTAASEWVIDQSNAMDVPQVTPHIGTRVDLGGLVIEVLGPERRYADPNDQSIVLSVEMTGQTMLLTGDIESVAQSDLDPLDVDVLKVPHHGGATSDLDWLAATSPSLAFVPVGANDFGHPAPAVIEALESAGSVVVRGDEHGDLIIG